MPLGYGPYEYEPAEMTDMIIGFDGKRVKSYNPYSGEPCPHYLTSTNCRTCEKSCLNCRVPV